jgi:hypothetical protein
MVRYDLSRRQPRRTPATRWQALNAQAFLRYLEGARCPVKVCPEISRRPGLSVAELRDAASVLEHTGHATLHANADGVYAVLAGRPRSAGTKRG